MYCTVLYVALHCTVLYNIVLHYTVCCPVLYCTAYCTVLYCLILHYTILYCSILYCILLYYTIIYSILLYSTILLQFYALYLTSFAFWICDTLQFCTLLHLHQPAHTRSPTLHTRTYILHTHTHTYTHTCIYLSNLPISLIFNILTHQ